MLHRMHIASRSHDCTGYAPRTHARSRDGYDHHHQPLRTAHAAAGAGARGHDSQGPHRRGRGGRQLQVRARAGGSWGRHVVAAREWGVRAPFLLPFSPLSAIPLPVSLLLSSFLLPFSTLSTIFLPFFLLLSLFTCSSLIFVPCLTRPLLTVVGGGLGVGGCRVRVPFSRVSVHSSSLHPVWHCPPNSCNAPQPDGRHPPACRLWRRLLPFSLLSSHLFPCLTRPPRTAAPWASSTCRPWKRRLSAGRCSLSRTTTSAEEGAWRGTGFTREGGAGEEGGV